MKDKGRETAIVIGAGMAGLCTAQVLSEHFRKVIVVERDKLTNSSEHRKGVPQSHHVHVLQTAGRFALDKLFPDVDKHIASLGVEPLDWCRDMKMYHVGGWRHHGNSSDLLVRPVSRPLLEWVVRRELLKKNQVEFYDGMKVIGLLLSEDRKSVVGVRLKQECGTISEINAKITIAASGGNSSVMGWFKDIELPIPDEEVVSHDAYYSSRIYKAPKADNFPWRTMYVFPSPPKSFTGGAILPIEGGQWHVTLAGYDSHVPPINDEGFEGFAMQLPGEGEFGRALAAAEPISAIRRYKLPPNRWRHFEKMDILPDGFIAIGNTLCEFNPSYGQGMTVAAQSALVLKEVLCQNGFENNLPRSFYKKVTPYLKVPWASATISDKRFSTTNELKLSRFETILSNYMDMLFDAAVYDRELWRRALAVLHMVEPPLTLIKPSSILKVASYKAFGFRNREHD